MSKEWQPHLTNLNFLLGLTKESPLDVLERKLYSELLAKHESGQDQLFYHNSRHCIEVGYLTTSLVLWLHREENDVDLDLDDAMKAAAIAGYLHDADHSLGKEDDATNIDNAIAVLHRVIDAYVGNQPFPNVLRITSLIEGMIRVTQFPFIHEPKNYLERCIRDADILYSTMDTKEEVLTKQRQLIYELQDSGKIGPVTEDEWRTRNTAFYKNIKFYTTPGQRLFDAAMQGNGRYATDLFTFDKE